jgi:magnesium transporter
MSKIVAPLSYAASVVVNPVSGKAIRCQVLRDGRPSPPPRNLGDLSEILKESGSFVWFDVADPGSSDLALLQEEFDLHPLAVEDAINAHQRSKIEDYGAYWFIVVHGVTRADARLAFHEIDLFVGKKFIVSVRHDPAYPLDEIERRWLAHGSGDRLRHDSGFLLYTILDTIVDGYSAVVDLIEDRVEDLEGGLFRGKPLDDEDLVEVFTTRRDVQQFRRAVVPIREILSPIMRGDLSLLPAGEMPYYRDVYDHVVRAIDDLDAVRDLAASALDLHLSVSGAQQNEVSKQLTIIATIFLPLTFVTGFFGQNFSWLIDHINGERPFWLLGVGGEVVALASLLFYFRRKGWF